MALTVFHMPKTILQRMKKQAVNKYELHKAKTNKQNRGQSMRYRGFGYVRVSVWRGVIGPNNNWVGWQVQRTKDNKKRKQELSKKKKGKRTTARSRCFSFILLRALTCSSTCK